MGWKPSAPKPDPNIGIAQRNMSDLAQQDATFFRENFAPRYLQQMDDQIALGREESGRMRELQDFQMGLARRYDDRFWDTTAKYQDKFYGMVDRYSGADEQERLAGQAGADVAQSFGRSNAMLGRGLSRMGVNPSSDAFASMFRGAANEEALARAGAMNAARQAARDLGLRYTAAAAGMGGELLGATQGAAGGSLAAGAGALGAGGAGLDAIATSQRGFNANSQAVGNLWNNVGQLGLGKYQGQLQAYGQKMGLFGDLAGTAAGIGFGMWNPFGR